MEPDPTLEVPTIKGLMRRMFRNQHIPFANVNELRVLYCVSICSYIYIGASKATYSHSKMWRADLQKDHFGDEFQSLSPHDQLGCVSDLTNNGTLVH